MRRMIMFISAILGATFGFLFLGIVNWLFSLHMSFGHVLGYGAAGGFVAGIFLSYFVIMMIMRWAKRKIQRTITSFPITRIFTRLRRS